MPERRAHPDSGELWTVIRSFTGRCRFVVAVVRNEDGHIRNVAMDRFETWAEA